MKRSRFCAAAGSLAAAALAAPAFAQQLATFRLASAPDDDVTPVLYGLQAGLFRSAGLDVVITPSSSGASVATAALAGAIELGKSSLLSIINAHARGVPLTVVAPAAFFSSPAAANAMLVLKESPIRTAADLNGKVLAVPALNDLIWISTKAWIDANGGDSTSVKFIEVPLSLSASALDAGRVAMATVVDPTLTSDMSTGKYREIGHATDAIAKRLLYSVWFGSADFVNKNHDLVGRFAQTLRRAAIYANTHHPQTIELLAKFSGLDPQLIARMTRTEFATELNPRDMQPLIDLAARYKVIPNAFRAAELISPYALRS